jgi:hypothetical protein
LDAPPAPGLLLEFTPKPPLLDLLPSVLDLSYAVLSSAGTWELAPLTLTSALTLSALARTDNSLDFLLVDNLTTVASTTTAALSPELYSLSA